MSVMAHLLAFLAGTLIRERDDMAGLGRRARGRSRVGAALLPVGQELRFCSIYARGAPARDDPELRVNVDRDRPEPSRSALDVYEARVAKRFLLDDDEGGLRPLAPRLDSNSKQDQQTDKYEESDRIQVDQGCGKLPDEQDQIDLTDHWNERQEPPRE